MIDESTIGNIIADGMRFFLSDAVTLEIINFKFFDVSQTSLKLSDFAARSLHGPLRFLRGGFCALLQDCPSSVHGKEIVSAPGSIKP
jgi:hypothetical protein